MSDHTHTRRTAGCFRCELNADEIGISEPLNIPTSASLPQHELEHAVALERERICQWIERVAPHLKIYLVATGEDTGQTMNMVMADAIRQGEHWQAS